MSEASENGSLELARVRVRADPGSADAWRHFGRALKAAGERADQAAMAYARSVTASIGNREFFAAEQALQRGNLMEAGNAVDVLLKKDGDNVAALKLSGDVSMRRGHFSLAETAYRACLALVPSYSAARHGLATAVFRQARLGEAWQEAERLLVNAPTDTSARVFKAAVAASIGDHRESIGLYRGLVSERPDDATLWLGLGHGHRIVGEIGPAVAAYREAITRNPRSGEAYWSLANLKNFDFTEKDIAAMTALCNDASLADGERACVEFSLGSALVARDEAQSFEHYRLGNAAKRRTISYDAGHAGAALRQWTDLFVSAPLRSVEQRGDPAPDPIFVVGLPRSGSTLVEQILGSHPSIEATSELPYLDLVAQHARDKGLTPDRDWALLGREYLSLARVNRHTKRPLFIDKMPKNFAHVGLIRLILPQAKIIDVRRHPLAACLSIYRQLFAHGLPYTYDLVEIAHWYRAYVAVMAQFEAAFPGYVYRLHYEALINDTDGEVRRLLEYVGAPFDPACLRFHANGQPVRTPSSEQVRRPIYREAVTEWHRYREQLAPAAELLADMIDAYPSAQKS